MAVALLLFTQQFVGATTYHIFKAVSLMPIQVESTDKAGNGVLVKMSLGNKELINLALGRSVDTAIPSNVLLALAYNIDNPALNKWVVFNTTTKLFMGTVANGVSLPALPVTTDKLTGNANGGGGVAIMNFVPTPSIGLNGIVSATTAYGAAQGTWTSTPAGPIFALKASALFGPMVVKITNSKTGVTTTYDGIVVQGMFQTSGVAVEHHLSVP